MACVACGARVMPLACVARDARGVLLSSKRLAVNPSDDGLCYMLLGYRTIPIAWAKCIDPVPRVTQAIRVAKYKLITGETSCWPMSASKFKR